MRWGTTKPNAIKAARGRRHHKNDPTASSITGQATSPCPSSFKDAQSRRLCASRPDPKSKATERGQNVPSANQEHVTTFSSLTKQHPPEVPADSAGRSGMARGLIAKTGIGFARDLLGFCTLRFRRNGAYVRKTLSAVHMPIFLREANPRFTAQSLQASGFRLCHFWAVPCRDGNVTCRVVTTLLNFAHCILAPLTAMEAWA